MYLETSLTFTNNPQTAVPSSSADSEMIQSLENSIYSGLILSQARSFEAQCRHAFGNLCLAEIHEVYEFCNEAQF